MEGLKGRALRGPICGTRFMKPYKEGPASSSVPGASSGSHQSARLQGFSPLGCTQTLGRVQRSLTWSDSPGTVVSTARGITCPCDSPAMGDGGGEGPGLRVCSVLEYRQASGPLSFLHKVRNQRLQQLTHLPGVTLLSHEAAFSSPGASTSRLSAVCCVPLGTWDLQQGWTWPASALGLPADASGESALPLSP